MGTEDIQGAPSQARPLPASMSLDGRRVLVTGAASGIGRATASCLAHLGASLVITDRCSLDATGADLRTLGAVAERAEGDLTDEGFLTSLIERGPYFALAHVAAVFSGLEGMAPKEAFDFVMDVNLWASLRLAAGCMEQMASNGGGYIVLTGSAAGRNGGGSDAPSLDYAAYAASKGGVHTLVRWLSRRAVGRNVLVNGVAPGVVDTPLLSSVSHLAFDPTALPRGRAARPEELGWPLALLCTPIASYMSGAVVDVNGGNFVG